MNDALLESYAELVVEHVNVQAFQDVAIIASTDAMPLVRALAARAYERGARFVDPWYFDPHVKRIRAERAAEDSLDYIPPWYGARLKQLGEGRGARISVKPYTPPGLMAGIAPGIAGRDLLPQLPGWFETNQLTNWCVVPWPTTAWARVVYAELGPTEALAALIDDLTYVLRLDELQPTDAWRERFTALDLAATELNNAGLDTLHFRGPDTDLRVGLLGTSRFNSLSGWTTPEGIVYTANLPSEEVFTSPDPARADGIVAATMPLDLNGTLVEGLRLRFAEGRVVEVDAHCGADAVRSCIAKDDGAGRLGEVALVDNESRVGKTGRVFSNTLLDENASSHLALGHAYAKGVGEADAEKINKSSIHVDFMIGGDDVEITGVTTSGAELSVLQRGKWALEGM